MVLKVHFKHGGRSRARSAEQNSPGTEISAKGVKNSLADTSMIADHSYISIGIPPNPPSNFNLRVLDKTGHTLGMV